MKWSSCNTRYPAGYFAHAETGPDPSLSAVVPCYFGVPATMILVRLAATSSSVFKAVLQPAANVCLHLAAVYEPAFIRIKYALVSVSSPA